MSRLSYALLAALALHGLLLLLRTRHSSSLLVPTTTEQAVELEEAPLESEPRPSEPIDSTASTAAADPRNASAAVARSNGRASASRESAAAEATAADSTTGEPPSANAAPALAGSAEPAPQKIDLGLDGHFFMRAPSEELPRVRKSGIQRELDASIAASDVAHGLARGNVLLGSLHTAVRDAGPTRGEALLRITVGPDGNLREIEFLQGQASEWASALNAFRELAMRQHLRVPPGARGLRVTFRVNAKVQLPSGAEAKGPELARPSLAPNGLVPHGTFDVADIGAQAQRLVYARVVSEEVL